jgi:hypothetical protein
MTRRPKTPALLRAVVARNELLLKAKAALGSDKLRDRKLTPMVTHSVARALALKAAHQRDARRRARAKR